LSLGLPGRDGYDIGRFVKGRDEYRRVPVLFLRGTFEPLEEERLVGVDHKGVIQKPFDSEKLAVTVRELIESEISPATLPEEHALGLPAAPDRRRGNGAKAEPPDFAAHVRNLVREEVLAAEREIEKRVRAGVLRDVREMLESASAGPKSDKNP
ncbi:MAG: hypothetical protein OEW05_12615, partial [Candidatus Aminicenantes bacterium]|nr:hypothetical protein [Candidatus Aminicenantes bacterium]